MKPSFLSFAILFQLALIGLLVDNLQGDTITSNQVLNHLLGRSVAIGRHMPIFTAYDASYRSQPPFVHGRPAMLIFASCDCQLSRIDGWSKSASSHGEDVSVVFLKKPEQLGAFSQATKPSGQVLAVRQAEFGTKIGVIDFPIGFHLASDGTIVSVER